jgi:hypothetical protein
MKQVIHNPHPNLVAVEFTYAPYMNEARKEFSPLLTWNPDGSYTTARWGVIKRQNTHNSEKDGIYTNHMVHDLATGYTWMLTEGSWESLDDACYTLMEEAQSHSQALERVAAYHAEEERKAKAKAKPKAKKR